MTDKEAPRSEFDRLFQWPDQCRGPLEALIDSFGEGFFIVDDKGSILHANPALSAILSRTPAELKHMSLRDIDIHHGCRDVMGRLGKNAAEGALSCETSWKRKDGSSVDLELTIVRCSFPLTGIRFLGLVRCIGDRRKAEEALKESEERFRIFSHASHEGVLLLDEAGRVLYANPAAFKITQRDERSLPADADIYSFLKPAHYGDEQKLQLAVAEVMPVASPREDGIGSDKVLDLSITGKDVAETNIELSLISENVGDKWHMIAFFRDVTDRKTALESLRRSERKFRRLFEDTKDTILMTTPDGKIVDINRAGVDMFGCKTKEEVLKLDVARDLYFNPEDRASFKAAIEKYGSASMHDLALKRRDGSKIIVSATVNAIYDEMDEVVVFHGIMRDVTGIRQLEQQVRYFQKMEAVRELIGDMAHHFNNVLNIIVGNAQLAKLSPDCSEEIAGYLSSIEEEVFGAADMVDELLASGSRHTMDMRTADVTAVVTDFEKMVGKIVGENIRLTVGLPSAPVRVRMDVARMNQALLNLVVNAREAMKGSGTLNIRAYTEQLTDLTTILDGKIAPGQYAVISVEDTGPGIPRDIQERVFEPFFTTDTSGEKNGLGLSVVMGVVKQHGGFVICDSEEGRGSIFKVFIPLSGEKAKTESKPGETVTGGAETVMICEDEAALRRIAADYLKVLGYTAIVAENGERALELFRENRDRIDISLVDIAMPGMGGLEVYEEMKKIKADPAVVFMTGYSLETLNVALAEKPGVDIIHKPFTMPGLARKIREILDKK